MFGTLFATLKQKWTLHTEAAARRRARRKRNLVVRRGNRRKIRAAKLAHTREVNAAIVRHNKRVRGVRMRQGQVYPAGYLAGHSKHNRIDT